MNSKLEKELYNKLINKTLPEDILIPNELSNEIKKEPTYEFSSERNYIAEYYTEYSTYKWESNTTRTKYNLPHIIEFSYSYPFDGFYNYKNLEKKTCHNIKSIIEITIELRYINDCNLLIYEHNNSDILDSDIILNKSI